MDDDITATLDRVRDAAVNDWNPGFRRCATCHAHLAVVVSAEDHASPSSAIRVRGVCPACPRAADRRIPGPS
ncbi:hypothetical protein ACQUSR_32495 [Streptomyces sp. P1-3]|uniref:hypothetical protein n=1 Tax=Streptomyces sp. P1-3 TaxID=3421658 RepID=UPI003D35FA4A